MAILVNLEYAWEAMQPARRKCERCGLYYRESLAKCRWCGELDERGLEHLKKEIEHQHQLNRPLVQIFITIAVIVAVVLLVI